MSSTLRRILFASVLVIFFIGCTVIGQNKFSQPKSVLHIITVKWKEDSTTEQRQKAIDGVKEMAAKVPGIKNVYLKTVKVQPGGYNNVIVMEFESEAAFSAYTDHPAHKKWEETYLPIREESRTHDVTN